MTHRLLGCHFVLGMILGVCCITLPGDSPGQEKKAAGADEAKYVPSELFKGELARIAPHLGLTDYGAVEISFPGEKVFGYGLEIWKNGKPLPMQYASHWPFKASEVTFSIREIKDDDGKNKYQLTIASPGSKITMPAADVPSLGPGAAANASRYMRLSREVRVKDGAPASVWILCAGKGTFEGHDESMEDLAKRVEWAAILKFRVVNRDLTRPNPFE